MFFPFFKIEIGNEDKNYPLIILLQYELLLIGDKIWDHFILNSEN